jgi:ABC-2 type transport system permease protein
MNTLKETLRIGVLRSFLEVKQFMRQRESVVFTLFFPVILLFIFGTVFKDTIAPGVTFSQYFVAGMLILVFNNLRSQFQWSEMMEH